MVAESQRVCPLGVAELVGRNGEMNRSIEQKAYAADLKLLSDVSLFAKLRAAMEQLRSGGRFSDADGRLMWQSMALESEVIDRFPEDRLKRYKSWLEAQGAANAGETGL